ncbi:uncharacterized protein LOC125376734 [Haliotis rufescens]|uniref:uncharacterized protein LOC125376734 n=1 Tax=Haliotis rufescens TaxID=6454 RepID=UPI00201F6A17|nr:uncharacterized protein LOC125376734 [Haliotis rufescens]
MSCEFEPKPRPEAVEVLLVFQNLWSNNGGRCGTCGDPYQGPLANDDGGRYDNGVIGRVYRQGNVIDIDVVITANHLGYFVLRLCEDSSLSKEPLQTCLNKHVLTLGTPSGAALRYYIGDESKTYRFKATLPPDVTCRRCVLQWDYRTGTCNHGYF